MRPTQVNRFKAVAVVAACALPGLAAIASAAPAAAATACGAPSVTVSHITVSSEENGPEFDGVADITLQTSDPGGALTVSDSSGVVGDDSDDPATTRQVSVDYFKPGGSPGGDVVSYQIAFTQDPNACTSPGTATQTLVVTYYKSGEGGEGTVNGAVVDGSTPETPIPAAPTPVIAGVVRVGEALTCSATVPSHGSMGYKWYVAGTQVATGHAYTPAVADYRKALNCGATGYNNAHKPGPTATTAPVTVALGAPLKSTNAPGLDGETRSGGVVRVGFHGDWSPKATAYSYQWFVGTKKIKGATAKRFKIPKSAIGKHVSVRVTASAPGYHHGHVTVKTLKIPF